MESTLIYESESFKNQRFVRDVIKMVEGLLSKYDTLDYRSHGENELSRDFYLNVDYKNLHRLCLLWIKYKDDGDYYFQIYHENVFEKDINKIRERITKILNFKLKNNKDMNQIYFKTPQVKILTEIYRRLNYFHKGNVNTKLMISCYPSEVKCIKEFGIVEPIDKEIPRVSSWYKLTTKGKMFFKNYIKNISEKENLELFEGNKTVNFIKSDLDKLTERISDGWVLDDTYYSKEYVKCDVYSKKFGRGTVYIMNEGSFLYTCSFGGNSDKSHSGSFFEVETIKTVEDGMKYLDEFIPLWISNDRKKIIELNKRYKF